jgi:methylated-DNA-[protein]-cysteine S-methyltransferase
MKTLISYSAITTSPLGAIGVLIKKDQLLGLHLLTDATPSPPTSDPLCKQVIEELNCYFNDPTHCFTIPLHLQGSAFQQKVWRALKYLKSGETLTYGQLAMQLDTGPRAIGQACRTNPIPIIIPCHRIVGANAVGGYGGAKEGSFMKIKQWLLKHEQK